MKNVWYLSILLSINVTVARWIISLTYTPNVPVPHTLARMVVGMGMTFLGLLVLMLGTVSNAFLSAMDLPQHRLKEVKTKTPRLTKSGILTPSFHLHDLEQRQRQGPYRLTSSLYSTSPTSSAPIGGRSTNFTQLITNCISTLSYENLRISLVEADGISVIEWLANFFNRNSKLPFEVLLEKLSIMEDQQVEIKSAYKSPDIKVIQTLSPSSIASSLSESIQYVCNCLTEDLQNVEKENEEALALATVRVRGSCTEYDKARLRVHERSKAYSGTTKERVRQDFYDFMNNVITSIAFDRYREDLMESGVDEANVNLLCDHIEAILNGTIEEPILGGSRNSISNGFIDSSYSNSPLAYDNELQQSEKTRSQQDEFSPQELLERLYIHGLVRKEHKENTKYTVDIDIYSIVDGVAKKRVEVKNDALLIMSDMTNRTGGVGSSQDLRSSPSINVNVAGVPVESPSFTIKFFQDIYKRATERITKEKGNNGGGDNDGTEDGGNPADKNVTSNEIDGNNSEDDDEENDDMALSSVGPVTINVSPDELASSDDSVSSSGRVGWTTGVDMDDGVGNVNSEAAQKTDSSGAMSRVALLDGGNGFDPPRKRNDYDDDDRNEEWDDSRSPVNYGEVPHGDISVFTSLIAKHEMWIRIISIKEEQEPSGLSDVNQDRGVRWADRDVIYVKYACIEATSDKDKNFLLQRWVPYEEAVELLKNLEQNMKQDREATQKFLEECQKFDILPIIEDKDLNETGNDTPFFGGDVSMM